MTTPARLHSRCGDGRWGYVDRHNAFVIAPRFARASDFSNGVAVVTVGTKRRHIDRIGRAA